MNEFLSNRTYQIIAGVVVLLALVFLFSGNSDKGESVETLDVKTSADASVNVNGDVSTTTNAVNTNKDISENKKETESTK